MDYVVNKTLDCKGLFCPMPLIKTKRAIKKIQVGQVLEMVASDEDVLRDLEDWASQTQQDVLVVNKEPGHIFRFHIRKAHE